MSTQPRTHTHTLEHAMHTLKLADTAANTGLRKMRMALAADECAKALGLEPRTPPVSKPAKASTPARKTVSEPKPAPQEPETPEDAREYRVCVLVKAGESVTHVWVPVQAAGPRRASNHARAEARRAGHEPVGVCAILREDAPQALLALAV